MHCGATKQCDEESILFRNMGGCWGGGLGEGSSEERSDEKEYVAPTKKNGWTPFRASFVSKHRGVLKTPFVLSDEEEPVRGSVCTALPWGRSVLPV